MRILVTRPREDGAEIARLLSARGQQPLLAPLLEPRFHNGPLPDDAAAQLDAAAAILATSANGIRALVRQTARRDWSIFAVGPQTADEARRAGFAQVRSADGDAKALAEAVRAWAPPESRLIHICAEDAQATLSDRLGDHGFRVSRLMLYRIEPATELSPTVRAALQNRELDAVMFFSPRTASIFASLAQAVPTDTLTALCISQATAHALVPLLFAQIRIAERPNQEAMLALVE